MKLSDVQTYVAARLAAVTGIQAFAPFFAYAPAADETIADAAIDTALRTAGVIIEITWPTITGVSASSPAGASIASAEVVVNLAERPGHVHSPTGLALVEAIIGAVTAWVDGKGAVRWADYDWAAERGYILHAISFSVQIELP